MTTIPPIVIALVANWASILEVTIPVEAAAGEQVIISIPVKNIQNYAFRIGVSVAVDGGFAWLTPALTQPGATTIFSASFIMPNYSVEVTITTYMVILEEVFPGYYEDSWYSDDVETFSVTLPGVAADGVITKKVLEWNGTHSNIPVSNIPGGKTGLVHITGKNNSAITQDMGIHWIIKNPDGTLWEDYWDWSYGHGPGDDHEFLGARKSLSQMGTYTITVALSFNPSAPEIVDSYSGDLCSVLVEEEGLETLEVDITPVASGYVETEPDPEAGYQKWVNDSTGQFPYGTKVKVTAFPYDGYVFEKWSDKIVGGVSYQNPEYVQDMTQRRTVKCHFITEEEAEAPFVEGDGVIEEVIILHRAGLFALEEKVPPVTDAQVNDGFKLKVIGRNNTERAMQMKLVYTITKPDESIITDTVEEGWPYTGGKGAHQFIEPTWDPYDVDLTGDWNLSLQLMAGDVVLDTYEGLILSGVVPAPVSILDTLGLILPLLVLGLLAGIMVPMAKEME